MSTAINSRDAVLSKASGLTTVAFVVNGSPDSAMGHRAREMASRISGFDVRIAHRSARKLVSIFSLFLSLVSMRPAVSYVFDISYSGIIGAALYKMLFRNRLIVETGDAITELVRSTGSRGPVGLWLTHLLETFAFNVCDQIVVRGTFHKEWLAKRGIRSEVIQDGVDSQKFAASDASEIRKQHGLEDVITVGLIGSSVWSEKLQTCYGSELVELLPLLVDRPIKGVMIGSGSGISHLKAKSREYGIEDRIVFLGYVTYEDLPAHLGLIDICLSTQTNNLVGRVRTTGKLPLYLAAGRYVLASNVGEALRVLPNQQLVDYDGVKDMNYPLKLKVRIEEILSEPDITKHSQNNTVLARNYFDYEILAERMKRVIDDSLGAARSRA